LFGWDIDPEVLFPFAVVLHWGTLLAVMAAFWSDLVRLISAALQGIRKRDPFVPLTQRMRSWPGCS